MDIGVHTRREGILHVRLPLWLKERAQRIADADRRTLTSIVEMALEKEIVLREREMAAQAKQRRRS